MLFNAVVMNFTLSKFFKILSITQLVCCIVVESVFQISSANSGWSDFVANTPCLNFISERFVLYKPKYDKAHTETSLLVNY